MMPMDRTITAELAWIGAPPQLHEMVADLNRYTRLAVDTESNSLHAYKERVCLIQFSTEKKDYLVDPLAIKDLSSLGPIFANPHIEKVFHAAEYDLICLRRDYHFQFANLFDTMLAGRILGKTEVGLAAMLEETFGIHLNKKFQRANWAKRPLPPDWLAYARLDTHYLLALRDRLEAELAARGRLGLAQEDFLRLCNAPAPNNGHNGLNPCWRISGSRDLSNQEAAVLNELCAFREEQARLADIPPFKIMTNDTLLSLAIQQPETFEELENIRGLGSWLLKHYSARILDAIRRGRASRPIQPPPSQPRPKEDYLNRIEMLRLWRKQAGAEMGVPSDVILPRDLMEQIALVNPKSKEQLEDLMKNLPWRMEHFGNDILAVIKGRER